MSEETTRAAVTDLYSAYAGGDGERMAALIADDVDFIIYGYFRLPATTRDRCGLPVISASRHRLGLELINSFALTIRS
jgi:ketosteroid isomerase-like protein